MNLFKDFHHVKIYTTKAGGLHLHEHDLTLNVGTFGEIHQLDHLDELVEVLGDLLDLLSSPVVVLVSRDRVSSSVGATVRVSML